jgi:hypothetical protein
MEHVDRPADLQALAEPAGAGRPWVDVEPLRGVVRSKPLHRIGGCRSRLRHLGQEPAVRSPEPERAVGLPIDLKALLVDCSVVPATE